MKTGFDTPTNRTAPVSIIAAAIAVLVLNTSAAIAASKPKPDKACQAIAILLRTSALAEATAEYWLEAAKASTLQKTHEKAALKQAQSEFNESNRLAKRQFKARVELCADLGEIRYNPAIDPVDFLSPAQTAANPNLFLPLVPGTTRQYRAQTAEGTELVRGTVTHDTRQILGVTCIVVRDTVTLNGDFVEDTDDYFAQDKNGNVSYFGELSRDYANGEIVGFSGSWEAGVDGAKPGFIMLANPQPGKVYRQEFALTVAEDAAGVEALNQSVTVPFGVFNDCLQTEEFTPIEPDFLEKKFYAPGVGLVLVVDVESGKRLELIGISKQ